jgi:hypothetical protein
MDLSDEGNWMNKTHATIDTPISANWSRLTADLLSELRSAPNGLSMTEAHERTNRFY